MTRFILQRLSNICRYLLKKTHTQRAAALKTGFSLQIHVQQENVMGKTTICKLGTIWNIPYTCQYERVIATGDL